jgi:hypothetical protein
MGELDKDYIVSLTTFYERFEVAHEAIESIFHQDCRYKYSVHLYLAKDDVHKNGGAIPTRIQSLTDKGLEIFVKDGNIRSYKKLVYALEDHPEASIITADDDIIYPPDLVSRLIEKSEEFPGCVACARAHLMSFDRTGQMRPYYEIISIDAEDDRRARPSFFILPTTGAGALFPPHSLDDIATSRELFTRLCPHADDIWFKIASLKKHTRCVQLDRRNMTLVTVDGSQQKQNFAVNVSEGENDRQLKACFDKFPELLALVRHDFEKTPDYEAYDKYLREKTGGARYYLCLFKYYIYEALSAVNSKKSYRVKADKYRRRLEEAGILRSSTFFREKS